MPVKKECKINSINTDISQMLVIAEAELVCSLYRFSTLSLCPAAAAQPSPGFSSAPVLSVSLRYACAVLL